MMKQSIKHIFLAVGLMGFTLSSCGCGGGKEEQETPPLPPTTQDGSVTVYVTKNDRTLDFAKQTAELKEGSSMSPANIILDPNVRHQKMDGFGAALTGSSCFNLLKMNKEDRTRFLTETFSPTQGMGMSYIRIAIGCSDFSLSEYTCCDKEGIENFALQNEELNFVIPVLKEILTIHPEIKILGSPWTSPRWMKVNNLTELQPFNSWTSGQLNPKYYADYGTYFVKWIEAMASHGIHIDAVTPQNEPLNRGNSASLYMGWREQLNFVKTALGPKLREAGLKTKIYLFDHNYNYDNMSDQKEYPLHIYDDAEASKYVAGAAYHNYGGNRSELINIHERHPDKELIFTETSIGTWNDGRNLERRLIEDMEEVALGTVNNWCKAVIVWNLMLDNDKGPNRDGGCQTCYGAVDINSSDYRTITRNSHYYIIGHLSAVVKPGAVRIGTKGYKTDDITVSAFENSDGSNAAVVLNKSGESKKITLSIGNKYFSYEMPSKSAASFLWKN